MKTNLGLLLLVLLVLGFQNCSRVNFDSGKNALNKNGFVSGPEISDVVGSDTPGSPDDDNDGTTDEDIIVVVDDDGKDVDKNEDKKDHVKHEDTNDDVVVVDDDKDEDKKDHVNDEDKKDEEKKTVALTDEQIEMFACSSDEGGKSKKVLICHYPSQDEEKAQTKCLPISALKGHMHDEASAKHKDTLGACASDSLALGQ